ncbi:MAG: LLM class flavin-dependent oxidoreductase [Myxococcota bacterium]|nr:LLM class flavin-dependent oxidoreductase [Myxococcota bacterium]
MTDATTGSRRLWTVVTPMPAPVLTALARQAEDAGFTGIFAPQVLGPPFVPLAAAAAVTERILLASGIAIAAARSPFETAMAAIDLDRISGGRFVLGLGASVHAWSSGIFGAPPHRPVAHLRETVAAVRHIVRGAHRGLEPFEGEWYRADFEQLQPTAPPLREEIPIWIAALRAPLVRLAAAVADGVMGHPMWSVEWAVEHMQPEFLAALEQAGRRRRDVEVNLWFWAAPGTDRKAAIDDARPTMAFYGGIAQYEPFFAAHGFADVARRLQQGSVPATSRASRTSCRTRWSRPSSRSANRRRCARGSRRPSPLRIPSVSCRRPTGSRPRRCSATRWQSPRASAAERATGTSVPTRSSHARAGA